MRVAVISDIHGNRHALEAVLDEIAAAECEEIWCLGDLVGYGADPDALRGARSRARGDLPGRQPRPGRLRRDRAGGVLPRRGARRAAGRRTSITPETLRVPAISSSPRNADEVVGLYHASPAGPGLGVRALAAAGRACLDVQPQRVALIGHSHVALSFCRRRARPASGETRDDGEQLDARRGRVADQPGQRRPAARRRPARRVARARHRGLDGDLPPHGVRHRRRRRGDPGRPSAGLAGRAAVLTASD